MQHHPRAADGLLPIVGNFGQNNKLVLPAFSIANAEDEFSTLLKNYSVGNTANTTVQLPLPAAIADNLTFGLAIRSTAPSGVVTRYALHKPHNLVGMLFPAYSGQTVYPSAVIELWANQATATAELEADVTLTLGDFTNRGLNIAYFGVAIAGTTTTLSPTDP